ncbi:MAG: thiamine phosphate synthase [Methylococcaceae bacterium]|nr:thiamine phosphate synthase [Methylococcaceae bacterium]
MLSGLYAITDATLTPDKTLLTQVTQAILGGVSIVQLRDKTRTDAQLYDIAVALQKLCAAHQVCFMLNDRLALAQQLNVDGLHIGQHDLDFNIARAEFPNKILGMSCYGDIERALLYQAQGADYVAFGACFNSPTKPLAKVISPSLFAEAKQRLTIPLCAIGGITLVNAPQLLQHGVDMVAVISDLWCSRDITRKAQAYRNLYAQIR